MGSSYTPTYRIEYVCQGNRRITDGDWGSSYRKHLGAPNDKNLAQLCQDQNEGFKPGGINERCGPLTIIGARIVHQHSGAVKATWGTCS